MNIKKRIPVNHPRLLEIAKELKLTPVEIQAKPWANAAPKECFNNTKNYAESLGGTPIYGWLAWGSIIGATIALEAHSIIKRQKEIQDITPYPEWDGIEYIRTFLPDPSVKHSDVRIPDKVFAMDTKNPTHVLMANILGEANRISTKFFRGTFLTADIEAEIETTCQKFEPQHHSIVRTMCMVAVKNL